MGRIKVMSPILADMIAAGEVVERPESVVKEILENAIDAEADYIELTIEGGGKRLIGCKDNGCGMDADDAALAFMRHATSKIFEPEDLEAIRTLGFRGEALPSIASVARVEVITKSPTCKLGTHLKIHGGEVVYSCQVEAPQGTHIKVMDLFYKTPARRKFLKSDETEARRCLSVIERIALFYKEIHINYIKDGKQLMTALPSSDYRQRIASIFGSDLAIGLLEVNYQAGELALHGYISKPGNFKNNRNYLILYLNGRLIKDPIIQSAIHKGYDRLLPSGKYPVAMLFLYINPAAVDINIHPTKQEVRFSNTSEIFAAVNNAVSRALRGMTPPDMDLGHDRGRKSSKAGKVDDSFFTPPPRPGIQGQISPDSEGSAGDTGKWRDSPEDSFTGKASMPQMKELEHAIPERAKYNINQDVKGSLDVESWQVVGQLWNTYIIVQGTDELLLVDQHVAHERIIYEDLVEKMKKGKLFIQSLVTPLCINLKPDHYQFALKNLEAFASLGFDLEDFGENTLLLRGLPSGLKIKDVEGLILDILEELLDEETPSSINSLRDAVLISTACKAAIKANQALDFRQMQSLIKQLARTTTPHVCPHGRPVIMRLSKGKVDSNFQRP